MYDLIIVGAGPAGATAAIYAGRGKVKALVLCRDVGGQAAWSSRISNYPGFNAISGIELANKLKDQIRQYPDVELREREEVLKVERQGNAFKVRTKKGVFESRSVIVASGAHPIKLGVPGEDEFLNKGVAYCAACDGPLFQGKDVAIVGGGNSALSAALDMTRIARKVFLVSIRKELGGEKILLDAVLSLKNIEIITDAKIIEIFGDKFVKGLKYLKDGKTLSLSAEGVFVEIGYASNSCVPNSCMVDFVEKTGRDEIVVQPNASTAVPGLFAAGDVANAPYKQVVVAAAEGCKAALSALKYLGEKNKP